MTKTFKKNTSEKPKSAFMWAFGANLRKADFHPPKVILIHSDGDHIVSDANTGMDFQLLLSLGSLC